MQSAPFSVRVTIGTLLALVSGFPAAAQTPIQVYGAWHCYTDGCSWASAPNMTTFDTDNRWLIDRNMNGTYDPSVNLVVLSFVQPVKLMNLTNDSGDVNGIPIGMNSAVINYFQSKGVRVMMSIGGASYRKDWDKALSANPTQLGLNAAKTAKEFREGYIPWLVENYSHDLQGTTGEEVANSNIGFCFGEGMPEADRAIWRALGAVHPWLGSMEKETHPLDAINSGYGRGKAATR